MTGRQQALFGQETLLPFQHPVESMLERHGTTFVAVCSPAFDQSTNRNESTVDISHRLLNPRFLPRA
jgi:hypothetical protein